MSGNACKSSLKDIAHIVEFGKRLDYLVASEIVGHMVRSSGHAVSFNASPCIRFIKMQSS